MDSVRLFTSAQSSQIGFPEIITNQHLPFHKFQLKKKRCLENMIKRR